MDDCYHGLKDGQMIAFDRSFRGHYFSDKECQALLRGESLEVHNIQGRRGVYAVRGCLKYDSYWNKWKFDTECMVPNNPEYDYEKGVNQGIYQMNQVEESFVLDDKDIEGISFDDIRSEIHRMPSMDMSPFKHITEDLPIHSVANHRYTSVSDVQMDVMDEEIVSDVPELHKEDTDVLYRQDSVLDNVSSIVDMDAAVDLAIHANAKKTKDEGEEDVIYRPRWMEDELSEEDEFVVLDDVDPLGEMEDTDDDLLDAELQMMESDVNPDESEPLNIQTDQDVFQSGSVDSQDENSGKPLSADLSDYFSDDEYDDFDLDVLSMGPDTYLNEHEMFPDMEERDAE